MTDWDEMTQEDKDLREWEAWKRYFRRRYSGRLIALPCDTPLCRNLGRSVWNGKWCCPKHVGGHHHAA